MQKYGNYCQQRLAQNSFKVRSAHILDAKKKNGFKLRYNGDIMEGRQPLPSPKSLKSHTSLKLHIKL